MLSQPTKFHPKVQSAEAWLDGITNGVKCPRGFCGSELKGLATPQKCTCSSHDQKRSVMNQLEPLVSEEFEKRLSQRDLCVKIRLRIRQKVCEWSWDTTTQTISQVLADLFLNSEDRYQLYNKRMAMSLD